MGMRKSIREWWWGRRWNWWHQRVLDDESLYSRDAAGDLRPRAGRDLKLGSIKEGRKRALEATLSLRGQHQERYFQRRDLEWKIALSLWAALGLLATSGAELDAPRWTLLGGALAIAMLHALWVWRFSVIAANRNRFTIIDLDQTIYTALSLENDHGEENRPHPYSVFANHLWAPTVTLLLGVLVALVLTG